VIGDEYHEGPAVAIQLIDGAPSQRVVVSQTKMNDGGAATPSIMLHNFAGQLMLVGADSAYNKFHLNGSALTSAKVGLVACSFSQGSPAVNVNGLRPLLANNMKDYVVPCNASYNAVPDEYPNGPEAGAAWMVSMFDKLRELGRVDWQLKYPHLLSHGGDEHETNVTASVFA
jgi:hypothetical protein